MAETEGLEPSLTTVNSRLLYRLSYASIKKGREFKVYTLTTF